MDEGLSQLIFILVIFLAAIFDSIARSRKKRQRMEEMEREEEAGSTSDAAEAGTLEPRDSGSSRLEWEPAESEEWEADPRTESPPPTPEDRPAPGERETADRMIPEDLWAVLTGEEPPARKEPPPAPPAPREAPRPTGRAEPPRPSPRWEERRQDVEDALGRRSDPDPPEQPHIPQPVPGDRYRGRAEEEDARGAGRRGERREPRGEPGRPRTGTADEIAASIEDPWGVIPDISEGEIGEEERPTRKRKRMSPVPGARRRRPASRYARLIEAGDRESLREAIVLREVLDVPLARRGSFGGWEEER